jgi:predicted Zn finger-like uncharacterized protein
MLIVCPQCVMSYQLDAASIGGGGRSVRCVRCKHVWFVPPVVTAPAIVPQPEAAAAEAAPSEEAAFRAELSGDAAAKPEPEVEALGGDLIAVDSPPASGETTEPTAPPADADAAPASDAPPPPADQPPPALSDIKIPTDDAPPLVPGMNPAPAMPEPADVESVAARRKPRDGARRRKAKAKLPLPVIVLTLVVVCAALIGWRKDIVRHAPQMASLYSYIGLAVNLRGLAFTDVKISSETHDGVPVLAVEGTIVNTVAVPVEVPRLRFAVRNAAGLEVYTWTAVPTQSVLEPGETLPFRSRLASPPPDAHDVQVRFFNRRDAVAGTH